jgi:hypothetical protein
MSNHPGYFTPAQVKQSHAEFGLLNFIVTKQKPNKPGSANPVTYLEHMMKHRLANGTVCESPLYLMVQGLTIFGGAKSPADANNFIAGQHISVSVLMDPLNEACEAMDLIFAYLDTLPKPSRGQVYTAIQRERADKNRPGQFIALERPLARIRLPFVSKSEDRAQGKYSDMRPNFPIWDWRTCRKTEKGLVGSPLTVKEQVADKSVDVEINAANAYQVFRSNSKITGLISVDSNISKQGTSHQMRIGSTSRFPLVLKLSDRTGAVDGGYLGDDLPSPDDIPDISGSPEYKPPETSSDPGQAVRAAFDSTDTLQSAMAGLSVAVGVPVEPAEEGEDDDEEEVAVTAAYIGDTPPTQPYVPPTQPYVMPTQPIPVQQYVPPAQPYTAPQNPGQPYTAPVYTPAPKPAGRGRNRAGK